MNGHRGGPTLSRIVLGLILITLGVFFTLGNLHLFGVHHYAAYWPVLLIIFGVAKMVEPHRGGHFLGMIIAVVGVILLLRNLGTVSWNLGDLWPLILAFVGLNILWHAFFGRSAWGCRSRHRMKVTIDDGPRGGGSSVVGETTVATSEPLLDVHAYFGETKRVVSSQDFRGGSVSVSMGSVKLDLRQAIIAADRAVLDVHTVMGGVEIRVPETWNVVVHTNSVLGGVDDSTHKPAVGAKMLVITGDTILGGVEVKN